MTSIGEDKIPIEKGTTEELSKRHLWLVPERKGEDDCEVEEEEADDGLDAPLHRRVDDWRGWVAIQWHWLSAKTFAKKLLIKNFSQVIVVTANYRVGPLGFMSLEDDSLPGGRPLFFSPHVPHLPRIANWITQEQFHATMFEVSEPLIQHCSHQRIQKFSNYWVQPLQILF